MNVPAANFAVQALRIPLGTPVITPQVILALMQCLGIQAALLTVVVELRISFLLHFL